ncbi:MAG TPA: hypothetical protein PKN33_05350 [Phycisphaerae bacterium]|nr:hypothetical protein [Phycisphaerae bacterium]
MSSLAPITFECRRETTVSLTEIVDNILVPENWVAFTGWGPLPGIRTAKIEHRTPDLEGTRFRVISTNGDTHAETIIRWESDRVLEVRMDEFPSPLNRMATHFIERWSTVGNLMTAGHHTVVRSFELHPKRRAARPFLRLIGFMMRRAVNRHSAAVLASA